MAKGNKNIQSCPECGRKMRGNAKACRHHYDTLSGYVASLMTWNITSKEVAARLGVKPKSVGFLWWLIQNKIHAAGCLLALLCLSFSLDPKDAPKLSAPPQPGTNVYHAIVFACNSNGIWSDPSNELIWTNISRTNIACLAWDEIDPTVTNFPLFVWPASGGWTNPVNAGTNKWACISLRAPTKTNRWITVSNWYFSSSSVWGPWLTNTGPTVTNLSNMVGMKFFRGTTNKPAWVSPVHLY